MGNRLGPNEFHPMMPRKKLSGALADWHPHPKGSNNSLVPVVRDAPPADDIADRFFDSTPQGYTPEPPQAVEVAEKTDRRAAIESAAARERRRYLMRYVAGAVGLASVIGLGALVRLTTTRDASAAQSVQASSFGAASQRELAEPLPSPATPTTPAATASAESAPEVAPSEPEKVPPASVTDPSAAVDAPVATEPDPKAANDAKHEAQRALDRGRLKAAIEAGERSVALDPTDADAWLLLGAAYEARGTYAEARRCFASCTQLAKRGARSECRALLR
jgi:tetratricopeptide (TPR) repeat protein